MAKDSFRRAIDAANSGQRFPVMSLVRDDPGMAAVLSKLIPDRETARYDQSGNREAVAPNVGAFKTTSEHTAQSITDARTVMQILPDMELAAQILVSSILSPKDMMTTELTYSVTEGLLAPEISSALIARTRAYFEHDYKIKPLLSKMLRDMLFETGSYPVAVIPENSIDEIINGKQRVSMESLSEHIDANGAVRPLGLLGPAVKSQPTAERRAGGLSLEAFDAFTPNTTVDGRVTLEGILPNKVETYLTVTDNHSLLKIPQINQKVREQRILETVGSKALESLNPKLTDRKMTGMIYKERQFNYKPISTLKTQEQLNRRTVGNPLVLHLPSESVIPVYVPGNVEEQIGFFVLIDADGNPVSTADSTDHYQELSSRLNSQGSLPSAMLGKVKGMMNGFDTGNRDHLDYSARAYGNMVEQDLLARLRNGVYGNGVALAKKEEVYRIMFARALAKQHTQLLFVPVELMTYFAFRYTANGVGKSLMEDMKILNSLRAMLLFANVMASLKNSIGRTEVKLKLDESDPNPQKTIETAMHEIVRSRQQYFPLGMNNPADLTDWLQKSGFEFTFEGHPGMPDVSVDFGEKQSSFTKPDSELEDSLRKRAIMATGLSPDTVDATFQAEFATSIVTNNILLSKRVMQMQEQFTPQLSDHLRKCMMNSEVLIKDLREILENNFDKLDMELAETAKEEADLPEAIAKTKAEEAREKEEAKDKPAVKKQEASAYEKRRAVNQFLNEYIMNFEVTLPKPNSVTLENQMTALDTYTKALDATLDAYVSDKFFTDQTGGDVANQVNTIKEVLKSYYLRQWMAENGVMTELSSLTNAGSDGDPLVNVFEIQQAHIEGLTKTLTKFMFNLQPIKEASDTVMQSIGGAGDPVPASDSSSYGSGGGGSSDGGGDGDGMDFDMGGTGSDDFGMSAGGEDDTALDVGGADGDAALNGTETPEPGAEGAANDDNPEDRSLNHESDAADEAAGVLEAAAKEKEEQKDDAKKDDKP